MPAGSQILDRGGFSPQYLLCAGPSLTPQPHPAMSVLHAGPSLRLLAVGLLALCSLSAAEARAQQGSSALVVSVTSQGSGRPVMGARVSVVGAGIAATTDARGRLHMAGVPAGVQTVEVRRLGYATRLKLVTLQPGQSTPVAFDLEVEAIPVAAIRVDAKRRDWGAEYLERNGFDRRRRNGVGAFITRAELERRRPYFLSDALRSVSGLRFQPNGMRGDAYVSMARAGSRHCPVQYLRGRPAHRPRLQHRRDLRQRRGGAGDLPRAVAGPAGVQPPHRDVRGDRGVDEAAVDGSAKVRDCGLMG